MGKSKRKPGRTKAEHDAIDEKVKTVMGSLRAVPVSGIMTIVYAYIAEAFKDNPDGDVKRAEELTTEMMKAIRKDYVKDLGKHPWVVMAALFDVIINIFVGCAASLDDESFGKVLERLDNIRRAIEAAEKSAATAHDVAYR